MKYAFHLSFDGYWRLFNNICFFQLNISRQVRKTFYDLIKRFLKFLSQFIFLNVRKSPIIYCTYRMNDFASNCVEPQYFIFTFSDLTTG